MHSAKLKGVSCRKEKKNCLVCLGQLLNGHPADNWVESGNKKTHCPTDFPLNVGLPFKFPFEVD